MKKKNVDFHFPLKRQKLLIISESAMAGTPVAYCREVPIKFIQASTQLWINTEEIKLQREIICSRNY